MRLLNFLTRWRKPREVPSPESITVVLPVRLQSAMENFESKLNDLHSEYVALRESAVENHARDQASLTKFDRSLASINQDLQRMKEENAKLLQTFLSAIAQISQAIDREVEKRTTAESAPCAAQAHPNGAQVLESPDPAQNLPPASGSETYSDGAASGSPAVDDSPA